MCDVVIRAATVSDVAAIVALYADDPLGAARETPGDLSPYMAAFRAIDADPNHVLAVAELDGAVVGTTQLTVLPGLPRHAATRAQIEAVRVARSRRGTGLGTALITWAIDQARRRGCDLVQLTSDASRGDARRFYERLGFTASHLGFTLTL